MTGKAVPPNGVLGHKVLKSNPSTNSLYGLDVVSEDHKLLVEVISKHIIYGMSDLHFMIILLDFIF